LVPDATAFIQGLYQDVLRRPAVTAEVNLWVNRLFLVGTAETIHQINLSHEHHLVEANDDYLEILHRTPNTTERESLAGVLDIGATPVEVRNLMFLTPEYQNSHPDNVSFVNGLFFDAIGRFPSTGEQGIFVAYLGTNTRASLVQGVLNAPEELAGEVYMFYNQILHRFPSAAESAAWVNQILRGRPREQVREDILGSPEYLAVHGVERIGP
jgi:hypothetical protein